MTISTKPEDIDSPETILHYMESYPASGQNRAAAKLIRKLLADKNWQLIDTAPRDQVIDLFHKSGGRFVDQWWIEDDACWSCGLDDSEFTHWMSLTATPSQPYDNSVQLNVGQVVPQETVTDDKIDELAKEYECVAPQIRMFARTLLAIPPTSKATEQASPLLPQQGGEQTDSLPCPFCGGISISEGEVLTTWGAGATKTQSMCQDCGALGPEAKLDDDEVDYGSVKSTAAWNRRAAVLPQVGEATEPTDLLITFSISIDRDKNVSHSDIQTHNNSFADVLVGFKGIKEEVERVFSHIQECPYFPVNSEAARKKIIRSAIPAGLGEAKAVAPESPSFCEPCFRFGGCKDCGFDPTAAAPVAQALPVVAETQQALIKALDVALRQNEHDMLMTGEELRAGRAVLAAAMQGCDRWSQGTEDSDGYPLVTLRADAVLAASRFMVQGALASTRIDGVMTTREELAKYIEATAIAAIQGEKA